MNVALVGASADPEKYAYKALKRLEAAGHKVFLVHPSLKEVEGRRVYASLAEIGEPLHTVTLYVSKRVSDALIKDVLAVHPKRILFNPGAENPAFAEAAAAEGIRTHEACTLVLLSTNQFDAA